MTGQKSEPGWAFAVGDAHVASWVSESTADPSSIWRESRCLMAGAADRGVGPGASPALLVGCLGGSPCTRIVWPQDRKSVV